MIPITPLQLCLGAWALFTAVHAAPLDLQPALERRALNGGPSSFDTGFAFYTSMDGSKLLSYTSDSSGVFSASTTSSSPSVTINLSTSYQPIDGVGVALTDASAYNMQQGKSADSTAYKNWLSMMFDKYSGLSLIRVPIGATDFSQNVYTLADNVPTIDPVADPVGCMNQVFDASNAGQKTLPSVQDIMGVRSDLKIMLTSWSAPAWMKVNGASDLNGFNNGTLKPGYEAVYAEYLAQTIKAWNGQSVPIWAITIQNEPSFAASYPSMTMNATQQNKVGGILKQRLRALKLTVPLVLSNDDNFDQWQSAVTSITTNATNIDGSGFHSYGGDPSMLANFTSGLSAAGVTNKQIHYTEGSAYNASGSLQDAIAWWTNNIYLNVTMYGTRSLTTWNMILDSNSGPHLQAAYCTNCQGSTTYNGGVSIGYNAIYYAQNHFGAVVASTSSVSGGGPAVRVTATPSTNSNGCIVARAYAAPYSSSRKRVGVHMTNSCSVTAPITITAGKTTKSYTMGPGLHSVVFLASV